MRSNKRIVHIAQLVGLQTVAVHDAWCVWRAVTVKVPALLMSIVKNARWDLPGPEMILTRPNVANAHWVKLLR